MTKELLFIYLFQQLLVFEILLVYYKGIFEFCSDVQ